MKLADVLAGRAGLAGLRWLLLDPNPQRVFCRELDRLLADGYAVGRCRLRRAKFKPNSKLRAYFDVEVDGPDARPGGIRPVMVTWITDGESPPAGEVTQLEERAVELGLAAPFRALQARVEEWNMHVLVSPVDARFPSLISLSDAAFVADVLDGRNGTRYDVRTIRYRPGERHVLRYDPRGAGATADPQRSVFARLYEGDHGSRPLRVGRYLGEVFGDSGADFAVAPSLGYLPEHHALLSRRVPGTPLSRELLASAGSTKHLRRVAGLLRLIHATPPEPVDDHRHEFEHELQAATRASRYIAALSPGTGAAIQSILERTQALHARLPQEPPGFVHGDFKLDHLWITPRTLTVIDLDRCCTGDPALDIGKLLADLRWWYASPGSGDVERAQREFIAGYFGDRNPPRLLRSRLYEAVLLVKITAHRVPLFDSFWQARTDLLIGQAEHGLAALERDPRLRRVSSRYGGVPVTTSRAPV
jgi:phosphotransferase family enzyme